MSPVSLNHDDIDAWLEDGFIQSYDAIKEEPPSPPNQNFIAEPTSPALPPQIPSVTIPSVNVPLVPSVNPKKQTILPKVPINRNKLLKTRPIAPLHGKILNSSLPTVSLASTPVSPVFQLNKLPTKLPLKTEQLNTALLPGEKYTIPPKIVKLGKMLLPFVQ